MAGTARKLTGWRRIANAMWDAPNDPQIYGSIDIDAAALEQHVRDLRERGSRATPTHVVGRALAFAIERVPAINVRLIAGYAVPRRSIDVFFITAVSGGGDLSGVKIERTNEKSVVVIADELATRASAQKQGRDPDLARTKTLMDRLPMRALRAVMRASAFVTGDLDRGVKPLSLRAAPFGSAMVSSVGMFGLPGGFAPIAWMYRVPILVLVGEITDKPVVVDGQVVARRMLPLCATIDHRYVDGFHIAKLLKFFKTYLADPSAHDAPTLSAAKEVSAEPIVAE
ncbi:MAG: 2-oxo acid dehydrogenase [Polyangiaceae bacterium]|nr:2-oxo acid dehydrogenase [Polyangiaceae bacterium]